MFFLLYQIKVQFDLNRMYVNVSYYNCAIYKYVVEKFRMFQFWSIRIYDDTYLFKH